MLQVLSHIFRPEKGGVEAEQRQSSSLTRRQCVPRVGEVAKNVDAPWYLWWLFLAVNSTTSGMKHYSEMEGTSVRGCLLGLKGLNSL